MQQCSAVRDSKAKSDSDGGSTPPTSTKWFWSVGIGPSFGGGDLDSTGRQVTGDTSRQASDANSAKLINAKLVYAEGIVADVNARVAANGACFEKVA